MHGRHSTVSYLTTNHRKPDFQAEMSLLIKAELKYDCIHPSVGGGFFKLQCEEPIRTTASTSMLQHSNKHFWLAYDLLINGICGGACVGGSVSIYCG